MRRILTVVVVIVFSADLLPARELETIPLGRLNREPALFDGKTVQVRAQVSGTLVEKPKWILLTVKTKAVTVEGKHLNRKGINFVIATDDKEKLARDLQPNQFRPATITATVKKQGAAFLAVVSAIEFRQNKPASNNPTTIQIIAEGVGRTCDEALKDAFRNAVQQVVGALVDAETLVKNDEVISDKVLTYSGGIVRKYEKVSKKEEKGLVRVKIKAMVEKTELVAKLKAAKVTIKDVDGKSIFAGVVTQLEAEKDAKAVLEKCLEGFPLNCIEATSEEKPKVVLKGDKGVTVRLTASIKPSSRAYNSFRPRLQRVLEQIARDKGELSMTADRKEHVEYSGDNRQPVVSAEAFNHWRGFQKIRQIESEASPKAIVVLNTHRNKEGGRTEWTYYVLDETTSKAFESLRKDIQIKITLLGAKGEVIAVERFLGRTHNQNGAFGYHNINLVNFGDHRYDNKLYMISPFFRWESDCLMPATTMSRDIILSLDELKSIRKVKIELTTVK